MKELFHQPVLLNEVVQLLVTRAEGVYLDCTLGLGGHAEAILKRLRAPGQLIGIDRDAQALEASRAKLSGYPNLILLQLNFSQIDRLKEQTGIERFTGILFDLGLGSWQISQAERGFSYLTDGLLDMRMDRGQRLSAYQVINEYSEKELARIFKEYGEEKLGKRIAREIKRAKPKIETTGQLARIIERTISPKGRIRTLSRVFQAIRMEVNQEIEELKTGLALAVQAVEPLGRIGIISYHSLEDRLVKKTFQEISRKCSCPPDSPVCTCGGQAQWRVLTKRAIVPTPAETKANPNSRSAKFRVIEKLESVR